METVLLFVLGVAVIVVGIGVSIGLHELGHLSFAKLFGVKVTQYMIGFGNTIWSRRKGETEYGVKAIPFGGYIAMIGMFPPQADGSQRSRGAIGRMIDSARQSSAETITPGDDHRAFYRLSPWKRIVVMLAGPVMNLLIAVVLIGVIGVGIGVQGSTTTLSSVSECLKPASSTSTSCAASDPAAPAAAAGLRAGDRIVSIDGTRITDWNQLSTLVGDAPGKSLDVVVERDGRQLSLTMTPTLSSKAVQDASGKTETVQAGVVGISPTTAYIRQPITSVLPMAGHSIAQVSGVFLKLPQRLVAVWNAAFSSAPREADGPVGLIGVGRFAGEVASDTSTPLLDRFEWLLNILAALNISLFVFNLIPLLPLDGGHVIGAVWEWVKRGWFAVFRRGKTAKPVDMARLMPLTFGVVSVLIAMEILLAYADIVKPVTGVG